MENEKKHHGGSRAGAGRKCTYTGGRQQLAISCSAAQKDAINKAAAAAGMTTAQYVLKMCCVDGIGVEK